MSRTIFSPAFEVGARSLWGQRYTASIRRRDGHTIDGIPGDCFRCAVAYLLAAPVDAVPHFGLYESWWWETRRFVRWSTEGADMYYVDLYDPDGFDRLPRWPADADDFDPDLVIWSGPSPRGPWRHSVVGLLDAAQTIIFDPHPSKAGLLAIDEVFLIRPALPWPLHGIPERTALEAA